MGLFDNIRNDILEEFESYVSDIKYNVKYESNNTFNTGFSLIEKPKDKELIEKLELKRWGYYPICPACNCEKCYVLSRGTYKCSERECRKDFNVLHNTVLQNTKIDLNKWYDLAVSFRGNNSVATRFLAKTLSLTQKTIWWMLAKLKTSALINEPDISIIHVLLTPNPFTHKTYVSKKPSFIEFSKSALKSLEKTYSNSHPHFELISQLLTITQTHFEGKQSLLAKEIGFSKSNLSRYLNGERKLTPKVASEISCYLKNKIVSGYEYLSTQSHNLN